MRSQLAGVAGRLMTVEIVGHDFERRLEARLGLAGRPAAEKVVAARGPAAEGPATAKWSPTEGPVPANGPATAAPQEDLFDQRPARPNDTVYRFPAGVSFGEGVRMLTESAEVKRMARITMRM